ncbi:MAG: hypothetical protein DHS20C16_01690 [Phycisphaerae bacterium]|nr:MAG: hypothetical protein DHS20C16_01690 [Phycisphaerae bacterium]
MRFSMAMTLVLGLGVFASEANAQRAQIVGDDVTPNIQASWNTASPGVMALRAPGNVVAGARADFSARHNLIIDQVRSGPEITEVEPDLTLEQQVKIDVINTLFTNLNAALTLLNNSIRINAGLDPQLPDDVGGLSDLLGNISGPS